MQLNFLIIIKLQLLLLVILLFILYDRKLQDSMSFQNMIPNLKESSSKIAFFFFWLIFFSWVPVSAKHAQAK
jgi:hypothetical protein